MKHGRVTSRVTSQNHLMRDGWVTSQNHWMKDNRVACQNHQKTDDSVTSQLQTFLASNFRHNDMLQAVRIKKKVFYILGDHPELSECHFS